MTTPIKQPKLLNYKNLNIDKYEYLIPHRTQNGYYQSICNYRLNKNQMLPFYFETPKLKTTSGIVRIDNKYYMDFELSQSGDIGLFHDFILKNDDNNISVCHENSKEWFNQVMPLNVVENYYKTPIIKKPNGQLPIFRVRLPSYKGNILTEIFNVRKEKVQDINCIQEGDYLIGILEFSGLMFMSKDFTPCYELHKIKLFKDNDTRLLTSGYMFSDMNEKVDLDNKNNIKTDNILEDSIVNTEYDKLQTINTLTYKELQNPINKEIKISNPLIHSLGIKELVKLQPSLIKNKKTLFDIIKETTLKDLLIDDKLFNNNNKLFNNNNKLFNTNNTNNKTVNLDDKTVNLDDKTINLDDKTVNLDDKTVNLDDKTIIIDEKLIKQVVENKNEKINKELKLEIQDIDNINLDIDYNLESPTLSSSSSDISDVQNNLSDEQDDLLNIINNYDTNDLEEEEDNLEEEDIEEYKEEEDIEEYKEEDNLENKDIEEYKEEDNNLLDEEENSDEETTSSLEGDIDYETLNDLEVIAFDE